MSFNPHTKPPYALTLMANKMPLKSHALFLIIDGRVENPEFVVWGLDDYREELWRWKKTKHTIAGNNVEYWAKLGFEIRRININAV